MIQAEPFKPLYYLGNYVSSIETGPDGNIIVHAGENIVSSKILIIAAGAGAFTPKRLIVNGIEQFENRTVLYSVQNKNIMTDKAVAIFGGGDSAVDWALELKDIAKKIYLIHRREKFRCADESFRKLHDITNIEIITPYQINDVNGSGDTVRSITIEDFDGNKKDLDVDYVLAFFGISANLSHLKNSDIHIEHNHIPVDIVNMQTNIPKIYAVGDVASYQGKIKLILSGFAEIATALHHAYEIVHNEPLQFRYSTTKGINAL
jgi:thioredoxin reductase (NADPH)